MKNIACCWLGSFVAMVQTILIYCKDGSAMCSSAWKQSTSARLIFRFCSLFNLFASHVDISGVVSALNWKLAEVVFSLPHHSNAQAEALKRHYQGPISIRWCH